MDIERAIAQIDVGVVQADSRVPQQHFARTGRRHVDILPSENIRSAILVDADCLGHFQFLSGSVPLAGQGLNRATGGLTQRALVGDFIAGAISECGPKSNPTETSEFVRRRTANSPDCVSRWPARYDLLASQTVAVCYNASWSCHCTGYPPRRDLFPYHPIFTGFIDRQKPVGGRGSPFLAAPDFACSRCSVGCCWPIRPRSPCSRE